MMMYFCFNKADVMVEEISNDNESVIASSAKIESITNHHALFQIMVFSKWI